MLLQIPSILLATYLLYVAYRKDTIPGGISNNWLLASYKLQLFCFRFLGFEAEMKPK